MATLEPLSSEKDDDELATVSELPLSSVKLELPASESDEPERHERVAES